MAAGSTKQNNDVRRGHFKLTYNGHKRKQNTATEEIQFKVLALQNVQRSRGFWRQVFESGRLYKTMFLYEVQRGPFPVRICTSSCKVSVNLFSKHTQCHLISKIYS